MDFHVLPRRDLQALCKRNGIRANMTNVAMADALAALPAVIDRIEEEEKEAAAEEEEGKGEMQGISLPGGRGVALTPHEVIILDDCEEEEKDLMPAFGVGRRRASRRAPVEPVAAPATRKRAATRMAETATEAVLARTTRARSQRTVVSAPEEEAPKARRTPRKTSTEQEEEEKGTQGDVSDDCVVDSSVEERQANVQQCQDSPIFQNATVSSEEIHHASEDAEMVPANEMPLTTLKSSEAAEEVDFTSGGANEENEVPTSGGMLQSATKAIEESVAAPTTRKRAAASIVKAAAQAVPARTTRARSRRVVVSEPEEEAPKARQMSRRAVARKTSTEQEEEEKGTQGDVSDDCVVDLSVVERQAGVQQCEDSPIFQNDTVSSEEIHHASEHAEMVPVNEVPLATLKSGEAAEEVDFTSDGANEENEVPTCGGMLQSAAKAIEEKEDLAVDELTNNTNVYVKEEAAVASDEMPQRSATVEEGVIEVVTVDNLSQATVTDDEGVVKESGFTADFTHVSIEEDVAVAADDMPLSLDESVKEEVVTVDNLSQATLTDDEGAVKESGFGCDLADVSVEEDGVVAADEMSQRSATLDESVKEEVATVENLSQATVTDDEWVVKESAFAGDLQPVVDTARDFRDHIASPLFAAMCEIATKSMSINSITEPVAVEREKELKEGKECEALGSLSLRKLRIKLKEKLAVAQENEADDVLLCMYNSSGCEKNASEPVAEEEMKEGNESEALGSLSLRKLGIQLKEKVAVAQENEAKEGKESKALDKLSLRKLKMKLKETLNAQKVGESHPSMY